MKQFKLEIILNEGWVSTTTTSIHNENEVMEDIVKSLIKEHNVKRQKYIIVLQGGKDNGKAKLSSYNERMLKKPINVILEECLIEYTV